jgi:hypothetical protein
MTTSTVYTENDFKASVGKYGPEGRPCYNTISDPQMVQDLLNRIPESYGGTDGKLRSSPSWGVASAELQKAIERFQSEHATDRGLLRDGHIDPHGPTIRALLYYAYQRVYQWADDTGPGPRPSAPAIGIEITDYWVFEASEEFAATGIDLENGVRLPLPPRGRIWPKQAMTIEVRRSIDGKDGTIEYRVRLTRARPTSKKVKWLERRAIGLGPSQTAKGILRGPALKLDPALKGAGGGFLQVLIPTDIGAEKVWQLKCTEGSAQCTVQGMTNF